MASGKPVAGAEVGVFSGFQRVGGGKTDEQGRWTGRVLVELPGWAINALKGGVGFDYAVSERARGSLVKPPASARRGQVDARWNPQLAGQDGGPERQAGRGGEAWALVHPQARPRGG